MSPDALDGLLILDKPSGITSRAALDRAARWFPRRTRIGHAGTLDPLATGILVLCLGSATRLTEYVQQMSKTYRSRFHLGVRSDSDDADGTLTPRPGPPPTRDAVQDGLARFVGTISQVPPAYSAAKVTGQRAYTLARRGEAVLLQPRPVRIDAIEMQRYDYPTLEVVIRCGKGTYIRSLARDLGEQLGCGAYVEQLRRTQVGPFQVEDAVRLDGEPPTQAPPLLPLEQALVELPRLALPAELAQRLCQGQTVRSPGAVPLSGPVAVYDDQGRLRAVALGGADGCLRPAKVLER